MENLEEKNPWEEKFLETPTPLGSFARIKEWRFLVLIGIYIFPEIMGNFFSNLGTSIPIASRNKYSGVMFLEEDFFREPYS